MSTLLIRQSPLATGSRVISASSELGLSIARVVADADNEGALHLRTAGIPSAAQSLDCALQVGGLAAGPADPSMTTPGAQLRWRVTGDTATQWRGWIDTPYLHYAGVILEATGTSDVPATGQVRTLGNGSLGIVYQNRKVANTDLVFAYKASRTGAWTSVTIDAAAVDGICPALLVFPSGRLVTYYGKTVNGQSTTVARTSTDHGATWADYATCRRVGISTGKSLRGEVVGDYVMLVTSVGPDQNKGSATIYWSADGGMSFGDGQGCRYTDSGGSSSSSCSYVTTAPGLDGTYAVLALAQIDATGVPIVAYQVAPGGGFEDAVDTGFTASAAGGEVVLALAARDDGALYLFAGTSTQYPAEAIEAYVSHTGGLSWGQVGGSVSAGKAVYTNGDLGAAYTSGPKSLSMGCWEGAIVGLMTYESTNASDDDGLLETWWGGWDSHTFEHVGTNTYSEVTYLPVDLPHNVGWIKTNVGAGVVPSLGTYGYNIVAAGADNFYWDAPPDFTPAAGESRNLTFVGRINSGGSVADNRCHIEISIDDGANRQWLILRFSTTQIAAVDNSGTLATVSRDLTGGFELRVFFKHDEPSAGGGLASARIRKATETHWTTVLDNQAIAEQAASAGDRLRFGGTSAAGGGVDWEIALLRCADDTDNEWQTGGFTNPDDLSGRGLGPLPFVVRGNVSVGGYHGVGVAGDTYTVATTYQYAASYIWSNKRPSSRWKTASDGADHTATCSGGSNPFSVGWVGVLGANYPTAKIQMHTADSWAAPAFEVTLSAIVYSGTTGAAGLGYVEVPLARFRIGQFRSRSFGGGLGRRWFMRLGGAGVYEITDNSATRIYVTDANLSGFPTASIVIYADRMSAHLPQAASYEFLRLVISSVDTPAADGGYHTGLLWIGEPLTLIDYAHGYSDDSTGNVIVSDADSGVEILTQAGPVRRRKRIAWDPTDGGDGGFLGHLQSYLGGVDINAEPLVLAMEGGSTDFMLVVADGPLTIENVWGSESGQLGRVAQLPLREYL